MQNNSTVDYNVKEVAGLSMVWDIISTIHYLENESIKRKLFSLYTNITNVVYSNNAQRKQ